MTMREAIREYAEICARNPKADPAGVWELSVRYIFPRSKRVFLDEVAVLRGQKIRRRVGRLPASVPKNGKRDVPGQTVFLEAI
jgi:hypothetical protein